MTLQERYAVITGGAGGIGLASARRFLEEGAAGVLLVDLHEEALRKAAGELQSDKVKWEAADVGNSDDVARYTEAAMRQFGRIDVLFLNAGIEGVVRPLEDYPESVFDDVLNVNVKGVWLGLKHAFPHMRKAGGGSVIITSSVAGLQGTANVVAYTTSKHAIIGTMRVAALEGASGGIRVNTIHPGPVDNRMMRSLEGGISPGHEEEVQKGFNEMIPLGRYGQNEEVAELALFLASDKSRYITGATYVIDGGFSA